MLLEKRPRCFILLILVTFLLSNINGWALGDSSSAYTRGFKGIIKNDNARYKAMAQRSKQRRTQQVFRVLTPEEEEGKEPPIEDRKYKDIIKSDNARYKGMAQRAKGRRVRRLASRELVEQEEEPPIEDRPGPMKSTIEGSVKMPMYAAADFEMGQYVVDMDVGTPPKKLRLVVDIGSDLTWVKCKDGPQQTTYYNSQQSSTYKPISCSSSLCKAGFLELGSLDVCPTVDAPCMYNYSYGEGHLTTYGRFGKESVTLPTTKGEKVKLDDILLGCTKSYSGKMNMKNIDGVLGLGIQPYSFSLHAVNKFGGTFSYCLVDHLSPTNVTNYLIFGEQKEKATTFEYMRFTGLLLNAASPYYWLNVKGMSIDNKMLGIPTMVWDRQGDGGTILDSGTTVTYLASPAYRAIMDVLISALEPKYPKLIGPGYKGDGQLDFEYCFNSTGSGSGTRFRKTEVPRLDIHFYDGARFRPHVKNYVIDDGPDVKCIGLLEAPGGMNIIGNIMQQNYLWEFDLHHQTVGFVPSTCR